MTSTEETKGASVPSDATQVVVAAATTAAAAAAATATVVETTTSTATESAPKPETAPAPVSVSAPTSESAATTPTTPTTPTPATVKKHKHEDENPLKLKPDYVLTAIHPTLTPLIDRRDQQQSATATAASETSSSSSKPQQKENRHRKNKRELKKRTREANNGNEFKLCKAYLQGRECPYGETCKFSHDMKEMVNKRENDIKEIDSCPHFDLKGECPFGISCRVGAHHLNLATGQNISKSAEEIEALSKKYNTKVMNIIPRKVVEQLRKKKYKFECRRHFDKKKKNENGRSRDDTKKMEEKKVEVEVNVNVKEVEVVKDVKDGVDTVMKDGEVGEKKKDEATVTEGSKTDETATTTTATVTATTAPPIKKPIDLSPLPKTRKLIDFSNKVYIAPLTTVGNLPFRRIMKKFQADITCGEMAVANNLLQGKNGEWALLKRHPDEDVFGVQIAAGHADVYTRISEVIEKEELDIDFLDMNLGCPIDVLCNQGCGAKLMLRDNKLKDSLKGMMNVLSIPITVKIRTGWDEKKPFAHKLVPKIQEWGNLGGGGVASVMIHGRSRLQRYSKLANWDYIQQVSAAQSDSMPKLPIIGNGDIFSYVDYEEKVLKQEGLSNTAMLGRGALIKPWLPIEIKERRHWDISATERLDFLKDFVKFGLEHWGSDQQGVNTTRRFLLEWLSFLYRYVPVGILEVLPQSMNQRPPTFLCGRSDLETLMLSKNSKDWVKISEMLLGPVPEGFDFEPKHKANSYK